MVKSIGITTGLQRTFTRGFVNAIDDLGAVGDGTTDDTSAIQAGIDAGKSVYFPSGFNYRISAALVINGKNNVTFFGDGSGSRITQHDNDANVFDVDNCNGITFKGLHGVGRIISNGGVIPPVSAASNAQGFCNVLRSENVEVSDNFFEGFSGRIVNLRGCVSFLIGGNQFYACQVLDADSGNGYDISVSDDSVGVPGTDGVILGNVLRTNMRRGISVGARPTDRITITGNTVDCIDKDGNVPTGASIFRKEGISLSYGTDTVTADQLTFTCQGNIVRNCQWTGIYINGTAPTAATVGFKGSVIGNTVTDFAQNIGGGAGAGLQGGIVINQCRAVNVIGNDIRGCTDPDAEAIRVNCIAAGGRVNLQGNTIEDVAGTSIEATGSLDSLTVIGNQARGMDGFALNVFSGANPNIEKLTVIGNRFERASGSGPMVLVSYTGGTQPTGHITFIGNHVEALTDILSNYVIGIHSERFTFSGNTVIGQGGSFALRILSAPSAGGNNTVIDSNYLRGHAQGFTMTTGSGANGPVVAANNRMEGVTQPVNSNVLFLGTVEGSNKRIKGTGIPTTGTWTAGDVVENSSPSTGQPVSWHCTAGGAPGTWSAGPLLP